MNLTPITATTSHRGQQITATTVPAINRERFVTEFRIAMGDAAAARAAGDHAGHVRAMCHAAAARDVLLSGRGLDLGWDRGEDGVYDFLHNDRSNREDGYAYRYNGNRCTTYHPDEVGGRRADMARRFASWADHAPNRPYPFHPLFDVR